ncbi:MAG: hypothetical protein Q4B54_05720 [Coriobacteriales bacterium]|nr:hypothetical protein [Coriobacteriales bacterium]
MARENVDDDAQRSESIEELVARVDADDLRAFVILVARDDEAFERELRSSFELADARQAVKELESVTESLWDRYERGGYITWHDAGDFEHEYGAAVRAIMRPFILAKDANTLIDLVVPRFVLLQQICIDDSEGFYTNELFDMSDHLNRAFDLADADKRARLLGILKDFLEVNPGEDIADIYEYEQKLVMEFLEERFARDARFAGDVNAFACGQIIWLEKEWGDKRGFGIYDCASWAQICLAARATLGKTPNELREYAEKHGLMKNADTVRTLANAYAAAGATREAAIILRINLDAQEMTRSHYMRHSVEQPQLAECLERLAVTCYDQTELAELYRDLLVHDWDTASRKYVGHWYDELRRVTDADAWDDVRAELLGAVSYDTANELLAHEGSIEELYQHIMANNGRNLIAFESILSEAHPEPYVEHYLKRAKSLMGRAYDRRAYQEVTSELAHAAGIKGGKDRAQAVALEFAAEYPRRTALLGELRTAGFDV